MRSSGIAHIQVYRRVKSVTPGIAHNQLLIS